MGAIPILVVAVAQGWALYGLHYSIEHKTWPSTELGWLMGFYAAVLFAPLALMILRGWLRSPATWILVAAIALVSGALGGYSGWVVDVAPAGSNLGFAFLFSLFGSLAVAWFIALPFAQARLRSGAWRASYQDLFEFAWQNALVLVEAKIFTGVFWLILLLWQALFKVIDIKFFGELFVLPAFFYPVTAITFGYAIYLIESHERIVVTLRRHLLGVFSWLLPLVAFIAAIFLIALPFTGLEPLWKTGHASSLMLWLQLLFVHFLNSAYQDGQAEPRYPNALKLALRLSVFALPIYAALCAYSLGLRVEQYGWTASRVWAAIATGLAALYAVGYAVAALRATPWMGGLARFNVIVALAVAGMLLLANTPVLDPKRLAATSQAARIGSGTVAPGKFDYDYLRFELGRYGRSALDELAKSANSEIARPAAAALAKTARYQPNPPVEAKDVAGRIVLHPQGAKLDPAFVAYLQEAVKREPNHHPNCLYTMTHKPCMMLAADLNGDGVAEVMNVGIYPQTVYSKAGSQWRRIGTLMATKHDRRGAEALLRESKPLVERAEFGNFTLGDAFYVVQPAPER